MSPEYEKPLTGMTVEFYEGKIYVSPKRDFTKKWEELTPRERWQDHRDAQHAEGRIQEIVDQFIDEHDLLD